jgi:hypothetical protein
MTQTLPTSPPNFQITIFLLTYFGLFGFLAFLLRNAKFFSKRLEEYLQPIIPLALLAAGAVWSQYAICLATGTGLICRIAQGVWGGAVALSTTFLAKKESFKLRNALVLGILYSLLIHGAKASTRYVLYGQYDPTRYRSVRYIFGRFFYGSCLVMGIAWVTTASMKLMAETKDKTWSKKASFYFINILLAGLLTLFSVLVYQRYILF